MAKEAAQGGDHASAAAIYSQVLQREPDNAEALAGLARAMVGARRARPRREQVLDRAAEGESRATPKSPRRARRSISPSRRRRRWARPASCAPGWRRTRTITRRASSWRPRCSAAGEREAAIDELLTLFKRDREWNEQAARKQLVKFFEAMGPTDPLTLSAPAAAVVADVLVRRQESAIERGGAA